MSSSFVIGVLAFQGGFQEHFEALTALKQTCCYVRDAQDLNKCDALVIPGGESTTFKIIASEDFWDVLRSRIDAGMPVWGTCAGSIILSKFVRQSKGDDQVRPGEVGVIDCDITRNYYGTQKNSFTSTADIQVGKDGVVERYPMVFIRAPSITRVGPEAQVIAKVGDDIVGVRQNNLLATTFHPELTQDLRLHSYFIETIIKNRLLSEERAFKRLVLKYANWKAQQDTKAHSLYLQEFFSFHFILKKHALLQQINEQDILMVKEKQLKYEERVKEIRDRIDELQLELDKARIERNRKLEYDKIAKDIDSLPSTQSTKRSMEAADKEIERLSKLLELQKTHIQLRKDKISHVSEAMEAVVNVFERNIVDEATILTSFEDENIEDEEERLRQMLLSSQADMAMRQDEDDDILSAFCILCCYVFVTDCGKLSRGEKQMWNVKSESLWDKWFKSRPKGGDKEWKDDAEKNSLRSFDEAMERMEQLDNAYEKSYQSDLLRTTSVFIIAPIMAVPYTSVKESQSTLNPLLYNNNEYNIVFKIGDLYPVDKPYLLIYLSYCRREGRPSTKSLLPIKAFFYDKHKKSLVPIPFDPVKDQRTHDNAMFRGGFKLSQTEDGAFYFSWTVPRETKLLPDKNYCLLFDMSSLDPSEYPRQETHNLSKRMPGGCMGGLVCMKSSYHKLKSSHSFIIAPPPVMFSEEWFSRQFGGRDLERFIGGRLFSFRFFRLIHDADDSSNIDWNRDAFQAHVDARSREVSVWFESIIKETEYRFASKSIFGGTQTMKYDGGVADAEDRRKARMRAIGLLYHPNGRRTLERIGEALLDVSNAYQQAYSPGGVIFDFLRKLRGSFSDMWQNYVGSFQQARSDLKRWVGELKLVFGNSIPTEKKLEEITETLGGVTRGNVRVPNMDGKVVRAPMEIREKIVECMDILVKFEIRMIISRMGEKLLERETDTDRFFAMFTKINGYDFQKYFAYAAVMKQYGTKFVWMARNYALFKDDSGSEISMP